MAAEKAPGKTRRGFLIEVGRAISAVSVAPKILNQILPPPMVSVRGIQFFLTMNPTPIAYLDRFNRIIEVTQPRISMPRAIGATRDLNGLTPKWQPLSIADGHGELVQAFTRDLGHMAFEAISRLAQEGKAPSRSRIDEIASGTSPSCAKALSPVPPEVPPTEILLIAEDEAVEP